MIWLGIKPAKISFSDHQDMNASYDLETYGINLRLSDTYGAFGSVGKVRDELVFEGTDDPLGFGSADWREYEFKVKPGDLKRRPPIVTPYHYRLDWQIWFAAMAQLAPGDYPWTINLIWKLLHNDSTALSLLAKNPFPDKPPRFIRAVFYRLPIRSLWEILREPGGPVSGRGFGFPPFRPKAQN